MVLGWGVFLLLYSYINRFEGIHSTGEIRPIQIYRNMMIVSVGLHRGIGGG